MLGDEPILTTSVHVDRDGPVVLNCRLCRAAPYVAETQISDAVDGLANPACTDPKSEPIPPSQQGIWAVGKKPHPRQSKASDSGSTTKVWTVVAQSAPPRDTYWQALAMVDVSQGISKASISMTDCHQSAGVVTPSRLPQIRSHLNSARTPVPVMLVKTVDSGTVSLCTDRVGMET